MANEGIWLSINEYSDYRGISISTIRRYIKASQVKSKFENGKYFIYVNEGNLERYQTRKEGEQLSLLLRIKELESKNRSLMEEVNELKMLVNIYENNNQPPPLIVESSDQV